MLCLNSQIHLVSNFSLYAWNNESRKIFLLEARGRSHINNEGKNVFAHFPAAGIGLLCVPWSASSTLLNDSFLLQVNL